jgi:hypothetical protein
VCTEFAIRLAAELSADRTTFPLQLCCPVLRSRMPVLFTSAALPRGARQLLCQRSCLLPVLKTLIRLEAGWACPWSRDTSSSRLLPIHASVITAPRLTTHELTDNLHTLLVSHLVNKFSAFYNARNSVLCSHEPASCFNP